jgi:hypothetical protein
LKLYHWDGTQWHPLPTELNLEFNEASAAIEEFGLYALMSSIPIPLNQTGWNLVSYPVQGTRPISEALASLYDEPTDSYAYGLAYGYHNGVWQVYAPPGVPSWVNDLTEMHFAQGYWISATKVVTWFVKGADAVQNRAVDNSLAPPATYYGQVLPAEGVTPTAGMLVQAWVAGVACGTSQTQEIAGQIVYSIKVLAAGPGADTCGSPGQTVSFTVAGAVIETTAAWQHNYIQALNLDLAVLPKRLYLPVVRK